MHEQNVIVIKKAFQNNLARLSKECQVDVLGKPI